MKDFKAGDKVRFVNDIPEEYDPAVGTIGTVILVDIAATLLVEWPEHSVKFNESRGLYAWWVNKNDVKKMEE